jgi:biotin synthase
MKNLIDKLAQKHILSKEEFELLIQSRNKETEEYLFRKARETAILHYGKDIYIRGIIEFTNYCKNDCHYCGIRKSNVNAHRYRLTKEQILQCCDAAYILGLRTFVLQGGEDIYFTDERMIDIIKDIRKKYSDCAITLSIGEKSYASYKAYFDAGANRYLLRHETANESLYAKLHPANQLLSIRKQCLCDLKEIGYQVGAGFMVGAPFQTVENIAQDLLFLHDLQPEMVGIGPFIPQHDTSFADEKPGTVELTVFLLGIIRLMLPSVLLPATTALGTIHPRGRELGILAGANVIMPNISPQNVRKDYMLYDNKIGTKDDAEESLQVLKAQVKNIGYRIVEARGDYKL